MVVDNLLAHFKNGTIDQHLNSTRDRGLLNNYYVELGDLLRSEKYRNNPKALHNIKVVLTKVNDRIKAVEQYVIKGGGLD
jgi:hypothetical protein